MYKNRLACSANITTMTKYLDQYCNDEYDTRIAFVKKLLKEPEIKLKEFNFKILHGILPCNSNLKKWKVRSVDVCDVCNQIQTIEHLLYGCCYVKPLWQRINAVFGINVSYRQILGLDEHFIFDCIATIVSFLVYKEWLLLSLEHKKRNSNIVLEFIKQELRLRLKIYEQCNCIQEAYVQNLQVLVGHL